MATISSTEEPGMQQIDLMKLNLQQLTQLKNQLDQVSNLKIYSCVGGIFTFSGDFAGIGRFPGVPADPQDGKEQIYRIKREPGAI